MLVAVLIRGVRQRQRASKIVDGALPLVVLLIVLAEEVVPISKQTRGVVFTVAALLILAEFVKIVWEAKPWK